MFQCVRKVHTLQNRFVGCLRIYNRVKGLDVNGRLSALQSARCMTDDGKQEDRKKNNVKWKVLLSSGAAFIGLTIFMVYKRQNSPEYQRQTSQKTKTEAFGESKTQASPEDKTKSSLDSNKSTTVNEGTPDSGNTTVNEGTTVSDSTTVDDEPDISKLPDIPTDVPYLIIGGGTAAFQAYRAIRLRDEKAKVLVVNEEDQLPYSMKLLFKELWYAENKVLAEDLVAGTQNYKGIFFEHDEYYCSPKLLSTKEYGGVSVAKGKKVTKLNVRKQLAVLSDGTTIKYGKCLIATGGKPTLLPVIEKAGKEVEKRTTLFRNLADFKQLYTVSQTAESVAVIGGGLLGTDLAYALTNEGSDKKLKIYQTFPESGIMDSVLPKYLSKFYSEKLKKVGVNVIPDTNVVGCSYSKKDKKVNLKFSNGQKLSVDHVVCAVGMEPDVDLAESSGLEVDRQKGGFLVNAELEARTNLWVAGESVSFYDTLLGRRRLENDNHASESGRLAGQNMTGAGKPYKYQSWFLSEIGADVFIGIGEVDSKLPTVGVFAQNTDQEASKAEVEKTDKGPRSNTKKAVGPGLPKEVPPSQSDEDYNSGVIFYVRDHHVVGLVLCNLPQLSIAWKILMNRLHADNIQEAAKHFNLYKKKIKPDSDKTEINSDKTDLNTDKTEINSDKSEINSDKTEINSDKPEVTP